MIATIPFGNRHLFMLMQMSTVTMQDLSLFVMEQQFLPDIVQLQMVVIAMTPTIRNGNQHLFMLMQMQMVMMQVRQLFATE